MKANINDDIKEGVIAASHGWGGDSNVNLLTSDENLGPFVGAALMRGFPCRLSKKK